MLTKKCKYAIKALIFLGRSYPSGSLPTSLIAAEEGIPKKFLETIMTDLRRGGYVVSRAGANGGHALARPPAEINLADLYRYFDGRIALVPCVSYRFYEPCDDCPDEAACRLRPLFQNIRDQTFELFAQTTLATLINQSQ